MPLSIGEVSRRSGLSHDTLRYYERIGLAPQAARDSAGRRVYDEQALDQLHVVIALRWVGFSIAEVQRVLGVKDGTSTARARVGAMREAIADLEASLDEKQRAIDTARAQLDSWRGELDAGEPWPDVPLPAVNRRESSDRGQSSS